MGFAGRMEAWMGFVVGMLTVAGCASHKGTSAVADTGAISGSAPGDTADAGSGQDVEAPDSIAEGETDTESSGEATAGGEGETDSYPGTDTGTSTEVAIPQGHPRLIVRRSDFATWRALRAGPPWSDIDYDWWNMQPTWSKQVVAKLSSAMLGYILDTDAAPPTSADYCQAVVDGIAWIYDTEFAAIDFEHAHYVGTASLAFLALLAFDVVYEAAELPDAARRTAEAQLEEIVTWYKDHPYSWPLSRLGLLAAWAVFQGDAEQTAAAARAYREELMGAQQYPDGSWINAPGYFTARIGAGERMSKTGAIDVLAFTGIYPFYSDPQMLGLMDWAAAFWLTPFGAEQMFGDTISATTKPAAPLFSRMGKYSERHGRIGKWFLEKLTATGFPDAGYGTPSGFIYATTPEAFPDYVPLMPTSTLKTHYGAALWGRTDSTEALMGTVHAFGPEIPGVDYGHSHQDTCSVHIAGYGEHLLFNSGVWYDPSYPGQTPEGDSWRDAWLQNTVLIGDRRTHDKMVGDGLVDGIVGGMVEFGTTSSGSALGNGVHYRTLWLVHATDTTNGYFALLDRVRPDDPSDPIRINLHPNSTRMEVVSPLQEYRCPADALVQETHDGTEAITVYYGTPPAAVNTPRGYHGADPPVAIDYLEAVYAANADGWLRAMTVLFPEDGTHAKPPLERVKAAGFSGVVIRHSAAVQDVVVAGNEGSPGTVEGVAIQAAGAFFRKENGALTRYAVVDGVRLDADGVGFRSDTPIYLQMDGADGRIASSGARVVFYVPGASRVFVDGAPATATTTDGGLQVAVPQGRHTVRVE